MIAIVATALLALTGVVGAASFQDDETRIDRAVTIGVVVLCVACVVGMTSLAAGLGA